MWSHPTASLLIAASTRVARFILCHSVRSILVQTASLCIDYWHRSSFTHAFNCPLSPKFVQSSCPSDWCVVGCRPEHQCFASSSTGSVVDRSVFASEDKVMQLRFSAASARKPAGARKRALLACHDLTSACSFAHRRSLCPIVLGSSPPRFNLTQRL